MTHRTVHCPVQNYSNKRIKRKIFIDDYDSLICGVLSYLEPVVLKY